MPAPPRAPAEGASAAPASPTKGDLGAKAGARVALAIFVVLSTAFILSSTWQLGRGVFLDGDRASTAGAAIDTHGACAGALRVLSAGVEHGLAASGAAMDEGTAASAFASGVAPSWANAPLAAEVCARETHGTDAYAAVERLERAAEGAARHRSRDLTGVRRDVANLLGP